MKLSIRIIGLVVMLTVMSVGLLAQSVILPKESKFRFGDNPGWAAPAFNDSDWGMQQLAKSFTKDSSYAWYRIKVIIPASLKTTDGKGLKLKLGKIDDADQTWFNGIPIGETGAFPPAYVTQWEKQRVYIIPENSVHWDQENVIAVRIYNLIGGMGMWEGPYTIEPLGWADSVTVEKEYTATSENSIHAKVTLTNNGEKAFHGSIKYWISNKENDKILFSETRKVQLDARKGTATAVLFTDYPSVSGAVFNIGYQVNDDQSSLFMKNEQLFISTNKLSIPVDADVLPVVNDKVASKFHSLPFGDQQFSGYLNTRFRQNLEQRLLKVDEPGLMGSYLQRPGIHPWAGEHVGKYLEAACNVWKLTHDPALKVQMDRMMYELINTQKEDGYLGTYTPDQYWTSWDVWSHKYNLYGLLAYYETTGYKPALDACIKMGDLLCRTFGNKKGQQDIILAGTHIGMAATSVLDPMVELYKYTGEKRYLDFCYYILDAWEQDNGPKIISALLGTGKVTKVGNGKAYEMLSNFVGLANLYKLTGDEKLLKPVLIAWDDIVKNRLYITGTTSSHEYFQVEDDLPGGTDANMGEGCVTTTWIQFNKKLFDMTGDLKYLEQIERSIYNHLLGAENPETGCVSYYTPLMGRKPYTCNITCCQSSIPRGIAMIPYFTSGNINNVTTLLMYEPATYKETVITDEHHSLSISLQVESDFPSAGNAVVTVHTPGNASFPVALRVPSWSSAFSVTAGGKTYKGIAGKTIVIDRRWSPGEKIRISFQMPVMVLNGGKSYPGTIAFQRGPQILALDSLLNKQAQLTSPLMKGQPDYLIAPVVRNISGVLPAGWIGKQAYTVEVADPANKNRQTKLLLVPFADASQTGGSIKVWMPFRVIKK